MVACLVICFIEIMGPIAKLNASHYDVRSNNTGKYIQGENKHGLG